MEFLFGFNLALMAWRVWGGDVEIMIEDCDRLTVNEGKVFTCMAVQRPCRVAGLNI